MLRKDIPFGNTDKRLIAALFDVLRSDKGEVVRTCLSEPAQENHALIAGWHVLDLPLNIKLMLRRAFRRNLLQRPLPVPYNSFSHIRLFFAYTRAMRVIGHNKGPDWPKLGPSILIATALIVAIRTAKWAAKKSGDAQLSDVDTELDIEVSYAARIAIRVMHELLRRHESLFPQKFEPIYEASAPPEDIQE